jgi:hypothetical protein
LSLQDVSVIVAVKMAASDIHRLPHGDVDLMWNVVVPHVFAAPNVELADMSAVALHFRDGVLSPLFNRGA